ncbi:tyrosine-type recombinase/integrase [Streptococcus sp. ZJ93]|uniref:tyrosine-type recombinase/integrase n=1 Tax=Streptococcus handemini TaxID=3161188 RepID=UPI0034D637D1
MKITEVKKKDGSIVYRANVYLGVDNITGKKIKTSITGRTKKEVGRKVKYAQQEFQKTGATRFKTVQVENYKELAELWLESYKLTVKPQSYHCTYFLFKKHILPAFGDMKLESITPPLIQDFINTLSKKLVNFKTIHSINRRILQYAVVMQLIPYNPAREIILPNKQKEGRKAIKFIDPEHLKKFLDHMEKLSQQKYGYYFDYVLYSVLLATGCRFGELVALEWSDIDLEKRKISINKAYNRILKHVGSPKSKAGTRTISIDKKTALILKQYRNRQRLIYLELGAPAPSVVFATPLQKYQNLAVRQSALDRRCKETGIPRFTFHAFRHTHASLLLNAGISYKELQHRLGHANISMTLDVYSHLSKEKENEAVSYFEKAINSL